MSAVISSLSSKMEISFNAVASVLKMSGGTAGEEILVLFFIDLRSNPNCLTELLQFDTFHLA